MNNFKIFIIFIILFLLFLLITSIFIIYNNNNNPIKSQNTNSVSSENFTTTDSLDGLNLLFTDNNGNILSHTLTELKSSLNNNYYLKSEIDTKLKDIKIDGEYNIKANDVNSTSNAIQFAISSV